MDILFFAVVAFYIFFKLREQLGKIDDGEKKEIHEKLLQKKVQMEAQQAKIKELIAQSNATDLKNINNSAAIQNQADEKILSNLDANSKEHFTKALTACNISAEFFLSGATHAFQMIIKSFASGDLTTLKLLLGEKIYQGFEQVINQRRAVNQVLISNIISIDKSEIISALTLENIASVTVKFVTKQINYITDNAGNIIQGRKDEIKELTDIWTFKKDLKAANPNWSVVSTQSN